MGAYTRNRCGLSERDLNPLHDTIFSRCLGSSQPLPTLFCFWFTIETLFLKLHSHTHAHTNNKHFTPSGMVIKKFPSGMTIKI